MSPILHEQNSAVKGNGTNCQGDKVNSESLVVIPDISALSWG
jgi:hypothetical protein